MSQAYYNAIFTTFFGLIGGLGNAISKKAALWEVTLEGWAAWPLALLTLVSYLVKCGMDHLVIPPGH